MPILLINQKDRKKKKCPLLIVHYAWLLIVVGYANMYFKKQTNEMITMLVSFPNLTQIRINLIWRSAFVRLACGHKEGEGFMIGDCNGRLQEQMVDATSEQVALRCLLKLAEQAIKKKPVSSIPNLTHVCFSSCLQVLAWISALTSLNHTDFWWGKNKPNEPFPS